MTEDDRDKQFADFLEWFKQASQGQRRQFVAECCRPLRERLTYKDE